MAKKKTKSSIPRKYRKEEPIYRPEAPKKITSKLYHFDKRYYFNLKSHRWKKHIDGDWDNGPLIYRVPLYPEQAVLSCCTIPTGAFHARFNSIPTDACGRNEGDSDIVCNVGAGGKGSPTCHVLGANWVLVDPLSQTAS